MMGLTLTQPWATLVAVGAKRIETRSWSTMYRGAVAIHAAKAMPRDCALLCQQEPFRSAVRGAARVMGTRTLGETVPRGVIVATATLVDVIRFTDASVARIRDDGSLPVFELEFGDYATGRFGFLFEGVTRLPVPVRARGMLGLWPLPDDAERAVREQLAPAAVL